MLRRSHGTHAHTLDRLAREGVLFERCFAQPVCAPSRFTLITGTYAVSSGPANHMRAQGKDAPEALTMRERLKHDVAPGLPPASKKTVRLTGLAGLSDFIARAVPELAANAMLCAVNQASYLLRRQIESQTRDFVEQGGFTERLYAARVHARAATGPEAPVCPLCGKAMRQRTASKGPRAGQSFWGCSGYPECKGTREMEMRSDRSDGSDKSDTTRTA